MWPSAVRVLGTMMAGPVQPAGSCSATTAPPCCATVGRKSWPSNCSPRRATNSWPGARVRLSVDTPANSALRVMRAPGMWAISWAREACITVSCFMSSPSWPHHGCARSQRQGSVVGIGKHHLAALDFLVGLVAFTGQQDHVPFGGLLDGQQDGGGAVFDRLHAGAGTVHIHAGDDVGDDGARLFAAGIVAGDEDVFGHLGDGAHLGALAGIAVAAAAEHAPQFSASLLRHLF